MLGENRTCNLYSCQCLLHAFDLPLIVQVELHFRELLDSVVTLGISEKVGYQFLFQEIVVYKVS